MHRPRPAVPVLCAVLAFATAGCETFSSHTCDRTIAGNPAVEFEGGTVQGGVYQSSGWTAGLLSFPGGMVYDLHHHLVDAQQQPATPRWVSVWVSLSPDGASEGGVVARASGNEAVILGVGPTTITVENAGCQDYWLLVAAGTGVTQP